MNLPLNATLDPAAVAKVPTQDRAIQRFEAVLAEAETVLAEHGLAKFSIPLLAERLGITRGSIYAYFPTHYAILNELVGRYLNEMEALFRGRSETLVGKPWREGVRIVVEQAVAYHNQNKVARLLILGGAVTDTSYRAQEALLRRLGTMGRSVWERRGKSAPPVPTGVDVFTLSVDIAVACFRRSVFEHGDITMAYQETAVTAMQRFLELYLDA